MAKDGIDLVKMRVLEANARQIGQTIGQAIDATGKKSGFVLILFSFETPELTYISNANRGDIVRMLGEMQEKLKRGKEPDAAKGSV